MGRVVDTVLVVNVELADGRSVPVYPGQPLPDGMAAGEVDRLARLGAMVVDEKPKRAKA